MACFEHATSIGLQPRETLTLPDVRGATLRVTRGTVWITQEDDPQDIVLRTGDTWTVERNGLTILEAQGEVTLCVAGRRIERALGKHEAPAASASVWSAARDAIGAFFASPTRGPLPYV
jgi:Protein of unknown function (DUF2917)